jgi:hypothetical protein
MAPVFNRAHSELRRPLGSQSSAYRRRLDVEENRPARSLDAEDANIPQGDDYEYDEAHDMAAGPLGGTLSPHRVDPRRRETSARAVTINTTRPTISAPPE